MLNNKVSNYINKLNGLYPEINLEHIVYEILTANADKLKLNNNSIDGLFSIFNFEYKKVNESRIGMEIQKILSFHETELEILEEVHKYDSDLKTILSKLGLTSSKVNIIKEKNLEEEKFLNNFTLNMNNFVKVSPKTVLNREFEFEILCTLISKKEKNNIIITGNPGVGKTSLVLYLAEQINSNNVPIDLMGKTIIQIEINKLLAGTKYRGEFEERLNQVIEIVEKYGYIIFIDEIHTLINAGNTEGGISASNLLKPYLTQNNIKFIGATTSEEYEIIMQDAAFERRFSNLHLKEFELTEMVRMSSEFAKKYEVFHKIETKCDYTLFINHLEKDLPKRRFPDKFLDFIDVTFAYFKNKEKKVVNQSDMLDFYTNYYINWQRVQ